MSIERRTKQMRFLGATGVPLIVALVLMLIAMPASAAPRSGTLDAKFGQRGRALLSVQTQNQAVGYLESHSFLSNAVTTATMAGGRVIVAGERTVAALRPDGKVDRRFGRNGRVSLPIAGEGQTVIKDVAVDPEGHILVLAAARFAKGGGLAIVARLLGNGKFDTSFAGGGFLLTGFGLPAPQPLVPSAPQGAPTDVLPTDLAMDDQGRLVVAGTTVASIAPCRGAGEQPHHVVYLARLLPDGSPDRSFGKEGTVLDARQPFYLEQHPFMGGVAIRGGEILYATDQNDNANCEGFGGGLLIRLDESGGRDLGFGVGGILDVTPPESESRPHQLAIDSQGRILVMRSAVAEERSSETAFEVVSRRNADGTLDTGFGRGGEVAVKLPGRRSRVDALAVDAQDRPLLAGRANPRRALAGGKRRVGPLSFVVIRLRNSGRTDRTFGKRGRVFTSFGDNTQAAATDIAIRGKRAVVAGPVLSNRLGPGQGFALARYWLGG